MEFTSTQDQKLYRVYSEGTDINDSWVFTQKTLDEANSLVAQGKFATNFDALQDMLSIPTKPTILAKAELPAGLPLRTGTAAGGNILNQTFTGGAQQIEILLPKNQINRDWFVELD